MQKIFCKILSLNMTNQYQRFAGNEKFPGNPLAIPGVPGKSGKGNGKLSNLHHSRNSSFPGNEFPWQCRE